MAKKVKTWLTDDVEAAAGNDVEADQTVEFSLGGERWEIDLTNKNAMTLRADIEKWTKHARKIGRMPKVSVTSGPRLASVQVSDSTQRKAARAWLRNNGYPDLAARGRIPQEAMDKYHARAQAS